MKSPSASGNLSRRLWILGAVAWACLCAATVSVAQSAATKKTPTAPSLTAAGARRFDNPQQAADVLIDAAAKFDVVELAYIFGPDGDDIVFSGEFAQDRQHAANFVAEAHEKKSVSVDPKSGNRAFLLVGDEDWPFPVPLVKRGDKWFFDSKAGRQELLYRRIGAKQLLQVLTNTYHTPVPTPVHNLAQGNLTCSGCHANRDFGSKRWQAVRFASDANNSATLTQLA